MSTEVIAGWLKDDEGNKFAPKTLASQVINDDGKPFMPVINGGTGATTAEEARVNLGAGIASQELWSGSWSSGTITVSNTTKYSVYSISISGQGASILAIRKATHIRGIGGYSSATPTITTLHFTATVSGDEWTFVAANGFSHIPSGAHGELISGLVINGIVGLC